MGKNNNRSKVKVLAMSANFHMEVASEVIENILT